MVSTPSTVTVLRKTVQCTVFTTSVREPSVGAEFKVPTFQVVVTVIFKYFCFYFIKRFQKKLTLDMRQSHLKSIKLRRCLASWTSPLTSSPDAQHGGGSFVPARHHPLRPQWWYGLDDLIGQDFFFVFKSLCNSRGTSSGRDRFRRSFDRCGLRTFSK